MIAYDKRHYHNKQKEPFYDPERENAEKSAEKPQYYRQLTKAGIIVRKYKPSVAELVMQRTDMILTPWKGEPMFEVPYGQDPYSTIGRYIRENITVIEDIIAVIKINEVETNQLFMVDIAGRNLCRLTGLRVY